MRIFFVFLFCLFASLGNSQNLRIAQKYYDDGEMEKAVLSFEELYQKDQSQSQVIIGLAKCYRQTDRLDEAIDILQKGYKNNPENVEFLLETAVTFNIGKKKAQTKEYVDQVLEYLEKIPEKSNYIARIFQSYNMLNPAIVCFKITMRSNPSLNYNYEIGQMYGELGNYSSMFDSYIDYMLERPDRIMTVKRRLDEFITEDPQNEANIQFRKTLLKKNQKQPDVFYNELLSWLYIQQKEFKKAFLQEKALYIKTEEGIPQLLTLAITAKANKAYDISEQALDFIIENSNQESYTIQAHIELQRLHIITFNDNHYSKINAEYDALISIYGKNEKTLNLMLDYAHFLGFKQNKKQDAIKFLKPLLKVDFNKFDKAKIEILLADILVLSDKFNQALIYYLRAKKKVKNHPLAQEASFKTAKASYYKGDFDWAKTQLNVLKASTTQLIANDAMELALLIEDNTQEDSTYIALKKYAKAELYTFQEQPKKAMELYKDLAENFKGSSIEDDALFKQAELFVKNKKTEKAINNYEKIIRFFPQSLLLDDAYFKLGNLLEEMELIEAAQKNYEQIIFNHADSIYYVEARKAYRKLRGDDIVN